jgi:SPP1 gp7 family putative phage head morphogenesis protein
LTPTDVETVVGTLDDGTQIAEIMRQFYPILLDRAWTNAGQQVELGLAFDLRNPRVQETITGLAQKVRRVAESTREEVRAVLARVDAEGLSYQQAAKLLRGVVETAPDGTQIRPFDSAYRSFMIAVTESAYAYSRGQILAWQESGDVDRMQWVAETNACPICRKLDGEVVILGAPFGNGLEVPAHPNCRCTLSPVLTDDFPLPAAPVSGPTSRPPGQRPLFTIRADGTLDYVPSLQAEQLYAALINPQDAYLDSVNFFLDTIKRTEQRLKTRQDEVNKAAQRLKRLRKGSPERLALEAEVRYGNQDIVSIASSLKTIERQYSEAVQRRNPYAQVTGDKPSQTIINSQVGVSPGDVEQVTVRVDRVIRVLDSLMPTVSAAGNPVQVGFQTGQALTVDILAGHIRASATLGIGQNRVTGKWQLVNLPNRSSINIDALTDERVIMHEILHTIETNNPRITEVIAAWYRGRTAPGQPGSQLEKLSVLTGNPNYKDTEVTRPDQFAAYYIGKDYGTIGTEVLSMFADYFYATPVDRVSNFIREDPEWVKLCIDVLADPESYQ